MSPSLAELTCMWKTLAPCSILLHPAVEGWRACRRQRLGGAVRAREEAHFPVGEEETCPQVWGMGCVLPTWSRRAASV